MDAVTDPSATGRPEIAAAVAGRALAIIRPGAVQQHGRHLAQTVDTDPAGSMEQGPAPATGSILPAALHCRQPWSVRPFAVTTSAGSETLRTPITDDACGPTGDPRPDIAAEGRDLIDAIAFGCRALIATFRARHPLFTT